MDKSLALELAEFLPKAWEQTRLSKAQSPPEHEFYKRMRGIERNQKEPYYPFWFFLAARWGADHPTLAPIHKDMSNLWDIEFPTTSMKDRVRGFKAAIESADKPSVIEAVTEYAPDLPSKAMYVADRLQDTVGELQDTRKKLKKDIESSNNDLAATNLRMDKVMDTCALVLSIFATAEGEKRKDGSEDEA
ncbi:hypothetical protein N0V84_000971 [Fusarium piperis]|uniref:Uncharacterized protein n=1 Tax=Fusarium piperis TaxID=1435070 RepID=A0A9W9BUC5_9HYPO|nr:hypothetical protein N0V84_000971 [Fusarium piperis]